MGVKYLWDTNIVIYFLQKIFPEKAEQFIDDIIIDFVPAISAITEIELLCWKTKDEEDLKTIKGFIDESIVFELDESVKLKTAELRRKYNIKLPDAVIAATAINEDLILLTRNVSDFKRIEGLKIINPWELK